MGRVDKIMKIEYIALAGFILTSCAEMQVKPCHKTGTARLTFYNKHEDKFGSRIASSAKRRATVGKTLAADRGFPFGTHIHIPILDKILGDGHCVVEDRGSAVQKRKASHGLTPVLDLYAETKKKMKQWARLIPAYVQYEIE
jgi:3D (Asp-Asp-Asp) domain-containing protein